MALYRGDSMTADATSITLAVLVVVVVASPFLLADGQRVLITPDVTLHLTDGFVNVTVGANHSVEQIRVTNQSFGFTDIDIALVKQPASGPNVTVTVTWDTSGLGGNLSIPTVISLIVPSGDSIQVTVTPPIDLVYRVSVGSTILQATNAAPAVVTTQNATVRIQFQEVFSEEQQFLLAYGPAWLALGVALLIFLLLGMSFKRSWDAKKGRRMRGFLPGKLASLRRGRRRE